MFYTKLINICLFVFVLCILFTLFIFYNLLFVFTIYTSDDVEIFKPGGPRTGAEFSTLLGFGNGGFGGGGALR